MELITQSQIDAITGQIQTGITSEIQAEVKSIFGRVTPAPTTPSRTVSPTPTMFSQRNLIIMGIVGAALFLLIKRKSGMRL